MSNYVSEEKKLYDFSFWGGFRVVEGSNEEKMQEIKVVASLSHLAVLDRNFYLSLVCSIASR